MNNNEDTKQQGNRQTTFRVALGLIFCIIFSTICIHFPEAPTTKNFVLCGIVNVLVMFIIILMENEVRQIRKS